jgi:hypothetical protein
MGNCAGRHAVRTGAYQHTNDAQAMLLCESRKSAEGLLFVHRQFHVSMIMDG